MYNEQTDASFQNLNSNNKISFLDPFIEIEGIWHVVGRLNKSSLKGRPYSSNTLTKEQHY